MSVWMHESAGRLNSGPLGLPPSVPPYLPENAAPRLERIRQARMLYRGDHSRYFLGEGRSQFAFRAARVGDRVIVPYVKYNALKLATNKTVDLLFGSAPLFKATDTTQAAAIAAMAKRTSLHRVLRNTAREACYEGEAFLEAVLMGTPAEVYVRRIDAATIHPVGELMPDGQYERYEMYLHDTLDAAVTGSREVVVVLKTTWIAGAIARELWTLGGKGTFAQRLELVLWPDYARRGSAPADRTPTGIAANTITYVANEDDHDAAVSDYDGLIELQDMVNHKLTQTAVAIAKHMDPKLAMPRSAADAQGNASAAAEVYFFDTPDQVPEYITWDAQLDAALRDRNFGLQGLLINAEISPVLLGLKEGAAPTAYKTLRLEAQNTLAMVARKNVNWTPGVERAVRVAQMLELTLPYYAYALGDVSVELRDGLPVDEEDQANVIATERSAGVLSVESAVTRRLGGDAEAVAAELARLAGERAAATPPILFGGLGAGPGGGDDAGDAGASAPAAGTGVAA